MIVMFRSESTRPRLRPPTGLDCVRSAYIKSADSKTPKIAPCLFLIATRLRSNLNVLMIRHLSPHNYKEEPGRLRFIKHLSRAVREANLQAASLSPSRPFHSTKYSRQSETAP